MILLKLKYMKVLSINSGSTISDNHEVTNSTLSTSTPFGYDVIIVNPSNRQAMYPGGDTTVTNERWKKSLKK